MAISIHTRLQSETIHVPEASELIGKEVRITIVEEPTPASGQDLSTFKRLAGNINLDWDAVDELRRRSMI